MRLIYCDLCGTEIGSVSPHGVESREENLSIRIGKKKYDDLCGTCYTAISDAIEELKRHASI